MKKLLLIIAATFFSMTAIAFAAPVSNIYRSIVPEADNTYYIGTTTPSSLQYKGIYTKDLTVTGTCTGCGSSASYPFTPTTNYNVAVNSTSTPIWFTAGLMASSTSYFPGSGIWNSSGRVGIGTTTLDIAGTTLDTLVIGTASAINAGIVLDLGAAGTGAYGFAIDGTINSRISYSAASKAMSFLANSLTAQMTLVSSGNVGIGITAPENTLQISTTSAGIVTNGLLLQNRSSTIGTGVSLNFISSATSFSDNRYNSITSVNTDGSNGQALTFSTSNSAPQVERMRITSTGNVGIATTSPMGPLALGHATRPVYFDTSNILRIGGTEGVYSSSMTSFDVRVNSTSTAFGGSLALNNWNDSSANGSVLHFGRSRSGVVGTYSPALAGDVLGAIAFTGDDGDIGWNRAAMIDARAEQNFASTLGYGYLGFYTANGASVPAERMRLSSVGNLGIATGDPINKLTISATTSTDITNGQQINLRSLRTTINTTNRLIGGITFTSNDTNLTAPGLVVSGVTSLANETHTGATQGTDLVFTTTGTGGTATNTEKVRITGAGNVGIGTTTPNSLLTLQAAAGSAILRINATNASGDAKLSLNDSGGNEYTIGRDTTTGFLDFSGRQTTFSGYKWRVNNGTEVMRITNGGNVGIGTTSPAYLLDMGLGGAKLGGVNLGGVTSFPYLANSRQMLIGWNQSSGGGEQNFISNRGAGGVGGFRFSDYTNAGVLNDLMTIQGGGNVGIGTTTPLSLLNVAGATAPKITISDTNASANQKHWFVESSSGVFSIGTTSDALATNATYRPFSINSAGTVSFPYASTTALTVSGNAYFPGSGIWNSSGNVGIGTTTPSHKLSIIAAQTDTPGEGLLSFATTLGGIGNQTFAFRQALSTADLMLDRQFSNTWSNVLAVQRSTGNVGIGTTTPGQMLSVAGDILGNRIIGSNFISTSTTASTFAGVITSTATSYNTLPYASTTAITASGQFFGNQSNTVSTPAYSWGGDTNTGIYNSFADQIGIAGGGTQLANFKAGTTTLGMYATNGTLGEIRLERRDSSVRYNTIKSMVGTVATDNFIDFNLHNLVPGVDYSSVNSILMLRGDGRVGISSSTPLAKLSVHANANDGAISRNLFLIASSTASATTTHFIVKNDGTVYAPNTTSSGSAQTGYWCYDADGQFVRTSTTCLVSASRFKEHVGDLDVGLAELMKLRPVSYFLKDTMGDPNNADQQIGFIAEEAQAVDARLVTRNSEGQVQSFRYEQFTALLTKAIQEQQRQIENLKVGVVEIKRSVEEDWQNFFLLLLFAGLIFQQVQINKLRK